MLSGSGEPTGWGYSWSDMAAGFAGAVATMAALRHRDRTGEGRLVDLSQFENLVALLGPRVLDFLAGRADPAVGSGEEGLRVPHGVFRCAAEGDDDDRWLALSVEGDATWSALANLLAEDGESWAVGVELRSVEQREERRREVEGLLARWIRRQRAEELEVRLQERGIAAGLVASGADLLVDPQLRARGYFATAASPGEEPYEFDGIPFLASVGAGRIAAPGPLCGEHTDSVLSELLGLGSREIEELRAREVIG
jgi:crotonobetainyl-CoA:carnitine CoA-transferase CaiB-like acyl-CoA transferase